jgi:hypothetical protein
MTQGNEAWQFFERDHITDGAVSAVEFYAKAYDVHPRNRDAVAALKKAADALLGLPNNEKDRQALAKELQKKSIFYEKYAPVVDAVRE